MFGPFFRVADDGIGGETPLTAKRIPALVRNVIFAEIDVAVD